MSNINYALSIMKIYPSLQNGVDFRCEVWNGVQSIAEWNNANPKPTYAQLQEAWFNVQKDAKKAALSQQCNVAITSGFQSSALGTAHTYPSDMEAQLNFNSTMNRFLTDSTFTSINFKTIDAGYLAHTQAQFYKVFSDGHAYGDAQIAHLNDLKAKVDAITYSTDPTTQATNQSNLDAITW